MKKVTVTTFFLSAASFAFAARPSGFNDDLMYIYVFIIVATAMYFIIPKGLRYMKNALLRRK